MRAVEHTLATNKQQAMLAKILAAAIERLTRQSADRKSVVSNADATRPHAQLETSDAPSIGSSAGTLPVHDAPSINSTQDTKPRCRHAAFADFGGGGIFQKDKCVHGSAKDASITNRWKNN